jgi:hypothetical protein
MMTETLGHLPKKMITEAKYSKNFFNKNGQLKRVKGIE